MNADFMKILHDQVNKKLQDFQQEQIAQEILEDSSEFTFLTKEKSGLVPNNQTHANINAHEKQQKEQMSGDNNDEKSLTFKNSKRESTSRTSLGAENANTSNDPFQHLAGLYSNSSSMNANFTNQPFNGLGPQSLINQSNQTLNDTSQQYPVVSYKKQGDEDGVTLTASQQAIIEAFDNQTDWDLPMIKFRQTIVGFLIGMFKDHNNERMHIDQIQEFMAPYYQYMRRRDGSKYTAKILNSIQGSLFSNKELFYRDCKNFFKMHEAYCNKYEEENTGRTSEQSTAFTHNRKKDSTSGQISTSFMKSKNDKKRKREIIEKFELIYQKVQHKLDNPFKTARGMNNIQEVWNRLSTARKGGFLNAFIILRPMLKKAVKQQERVQKAISLLIKSGIFRKKNTTALSNPLDGIPIITHQDATKLLEMEISLINMNDKINSIFLRTKENLDSYHQKLQQQQQQTNQ